MARHHQESLGRGCDNGWEEEDEFQHLEEDMQEVSAGGRGRVYICSCICDSGVEFDGRI